LAEQFNTPEIIVEGYAAAIRSGFELASRRAQALQEYWAAVPHLREPKDLVALQTGFWRRAIDDYGAVLREALRPPEPAVAAASAAAPAGKAQARAA
jgi:hypothetical protein